MKKLTERQRFERWAERFGADLTLYEYDGGKLNYLNPHTEEMFHAWQASARVKRDKGGRK